MSIRGLKEFLTEKGLFKVEKLSALQNCRIGIQGDHWLKSLNINDPLYAAIGGIPFTLLDTITKEVSQFREAGIQPFFVFNGLPLIRHDKPFSKPDTNLSLREQAWKQYQTTNQTNGFKTEKNIVQNFIPSIIKHLHTLNIESFVSPYQARPQLAFFNLFQGSQLPLVHNVYGGIEMLLFGIPSIITNIDFNKGVFTWIDYTEILKELDISHDQFVDISILAGFDLASTFPIISSTKVTNNNESPYWRAAYDLIQHHHNIYNLLQAYTDHPLIVRLDYQKIYCKAKALLQYHLILDRSVECRPLTSRAPRDIDEITGPRFPDSLYYLLSQSIISPQVLNTLSSGLLIESSPYVDSEIYRQTLNFLTSIRTSTIALLSNHLFPYHQKRKISTIRWYDPNSEIEMDHSNEQMKKKLSMVPPMLNVNFQLPSQLTNGFYNIGFNCCLQPLSSNILTSQSLKYSLQSSEEILSTVLLHLLVARGYSSVSTDTGNDSQEVQSSATLTDLGQALLLVNPQFQEQAFIVLELVTNNSLTGERFCMNNSSNIENEKEICLLTSVFSLLSIEPNMSETTWKGPIDQELMAFNCIVKAYYKTLRHLTEMIFVNLYLSGFISPTSDYSQLQRVSDYFPFCQEQSAALGLALKAFLLEKSNTQFPNFKNVTSDLRKGYEFWSQVYEAVLFLQAKGVIQTKIFNLFEKANLFIKEKFSKL